jgi:hypothetical protein
MLKIGFDRFSKPGNNMKIFVVTCYMEGCEDCNNEYHVVGAFTTLENAEKSRAFHEKNARHLHDCMCQVTDVLIDDFTYS